MSIQYLVDFENVHEAGLYGMDSLTAEDGVIIFHTLYHGGLEITTFSAPDGCISTVLVYGLQRLFIQGVKLIVKVRVSLIQVIVYYCSCPIIIVANSLKLYEIFSGHFLTQENHNANAFFLPNTFR